ncbi:hypothetical protein [Vulcanisaeta sp. JCM 14467]
MRLVLVLYFIRTLYDTLPLVSLGDVKCYPKGDALIINGLTVKLQFHDDYINLGPAKFKDLHLEDGYSPVIETFVKQEYWFGNVSDFVDDSVIYFALKGAKKAYAVELIRVPNAEMLKTPN